MDAASTALFADMWYPNEHMGGGWWVVMMIWMVLFWSAAIVGVVWLARRGPSVWSRAESRETPIEILDRRFAEGHVSADEYHERRKVIRNGGSRTGGSS